MQLPPQDLHNAISADPILQSIYNTDKFQMDYAQMLLHWGFKISPDKMLELLLRGKKSNNVEYRQWIDGFYALTISEYRNSKYDYLTRLSLNLDIDQRFADKTTALFWASMRGHTKIVEMLLAAGVDVNIQDIEGATPIMMASHYGHIEIVKMLLEYGADPLLRDLYGQTAREFALDGKAENKDEIIALLDETINNYLLSNMELLRQTRG